MNQNYIQNLGGKSDYHILEIEGTKTRIELIKTGINKKIDKILDVSKDTKVIREIDFETKNLDDLTELIKQREEVFIKMQRSEQLTPYEQKIFDNRFEIVENYNLEKILQEGDIKDLHKLEETIEELIKRNINNKLKEQIEEVRKKILLGNITEYEFFSDYGLKFKDIKSCKLSNEAIGKIRNDFLQKNDGEIFSFFIYDEFGLDFLIKKGLISKSDFRHSSINASEKVLKKEVLEKLKSQFFSDIKPLFAECVESKINNLKIDLNNGDYFKEFENNSYNFFAGYTKISIQDLENITITDESLLKIKKIITKDVLSKEKKIYNYQRIYENIKYDEFMLDFDYEKLGKKILDNDDLLSRFKDRQDTLLKSIKNKPEGEFAIINSSQESSHLFTKDDLKVGGHLVGNNNIDYSRFKGLYSINAGVICFVDKDGFIWIGKYSNESIENIEKAGYKRGGFGVPHSNDGGYWMRTDFNRYLLQTELYNKKRISIEDFNKNFNARVVHTLRVEKLNSGAIEGDSNLPKTIEAMLEKIENDKEIVTSASTIPLGHKIDDNTSLLWGGHNHPFGIIVEDGTITEFTCLRDASTYPMDRNLTLQVPEESLEGEKVGIHLKEKSKLIYQGGYDEVGVNIKKYSCFFMFPDFSKVNVNFNPNDIITEIYKLNTYATSKNIKMSIFEDGIFKEVIFQKRNFDVQDIGDNKLYLDDINLNISGIKKETAIALLRYQATKEGKNLILRSESIKNLNTNSSKKQIEVSLPIYK